MHTRARMAAVLILGVLSSAPLACRPVTSGSDGGELALDGGGACPSDVVPADGLVLTERGAVRGARAGGAWAFKGIPYAAAPVGALRWRAPAPHPCWEGVRPAEAFGPACPQLSGGAFVGDEDCLTLNVWTPSPPPASAPVLVFLHGGFNFRGSSDAQVGDLHVYDGAYLAEHGPAVVVTVNYRLGALGFLVHPSLERPGEPSGNYGLRDQLAALEWVQRNIAAFGGDPSRVLLFGQSAGSIDTCMLLASPLAKGLFSRAMTLSGACAALTREGSELAGQALATNTGCASAPDVAACLRAKSAFTVASATFGPTATSDGAHPWVDGVVLPERPDVVFAAGEHNPMPVVIGTARDEMKVLATGLLTAPLDTEPKYRAAVEQMFQEAGAVVAQARRLNLIRQPGPYSDRILAAYPASGYPSYNDAFLAILGDLYYHCPARRTARALSAGQPSQPVYRAVFEHAFSSGPLAPFGAAHGFDLFFGFHNLSPYGYAPTSGDLAVAGTLSGAWRRFAESGDPTPPGAAGWPSYAQPSESDVRLGPSVTTGAGFRAAQCDFWDAL